jgi:DNA-binding LacI/PurR family transcriptional regulator
MVSIKDIARAARVSHSTVSRALHDSPLVNPKTRARIRRIAEQQGYTPSAVARSLVTRRTNTIGVVVTSIADPFVGEVVSGIEEAVLANGYSLILTTCHANPEREMMAVRSLHERRVDGILVTASRVGALYLPMLEEIGVPIVLINNQHPGEFVFSVSIDSRTGARDAVRHLTALGHRRIAYIGDQQGYQSDTERDAGYRDALAEAGIGFREEYMAKGDGRPESAYFAMSRLLELPGPPTAVFCYNDMQAFGAMRAARERGLSIPRDISIVGFDDLFLSSYSDPPLTTVHQPKPEMGRQSARLLLDLLTGAKKPQSALVPGELIVRQSTAPPRDAGTR